jgi:hypothetical protein
MPGFLPATGSQISFGRVNQAYTNNAPGAAGNAPSGGQNISLSATLGSQPVYGVSQAVGTEIRFSATFGGRYYPFTY